MNLEDQVVNLELSRKLKELGIKQESQFYWEYLCEEAHSIVWFPYCITPRNEGFYQHFSAFTTAELLELLPQTITTPYGAPFDNYRLGVHASVIVKNPEHIDPIRTHIVNYRCDSIDMTDKQTILSGALGKYLTKNIWDENSANALAKMLIYLIENKLYEVVSEN